MILASEYILVLQELVKQYGDLSLIYSSDSEGNSYNKVSYLPSEFLVDDLDDYALEHISLNPEDYDENEQIPKPNCFIIN